MSRQLWVALITIMAFLTFVVLLPGCGGGGGDSGGGSYSSGSGDGGNNGGSTIPTITAVNPNSGSAGTTVVLTGADLGTSGTVLFGSTTATATSWSSTGISTTVPAGIPAGTVTISVTPNDLTTAATISFAVTSSTTTISSIRPNPCAVGTAITISGINLGNAGILNIGGVAVSPASWTDTAIMATVPIGTQPGITAVSVTPSGGPTITATITIAGLTTPTITSVSPYSGPVGTAVNLTGINLGAGGTIHFGSTPSTVTSWSSTGISTTVPAGIPAGTVTISVMPTGSTTTATTNFTVTNTQGATEIKESVTDSNGESTFSLTNVGPDVVVKVVDDEGKTPQDLRVQLITNGYDYVLFISDDNQNFFPTVMSGKVSELPTKVMAKGDRGFLVILAGVVAIYGIVRYPVGSYAMIHGSIEIDS